MRHLRWWMLILWGTDYYEWEEVPKRTISTCPQQSHGQGNCTRETETQYVGGERMSQQLLCSKRLLSSLFISIGKWRFPGTDDGELIEYKSRGQEGVAKLLFLLHSIGIWIDVVKEFLVVSISVYLNRFKGSDVQVLEFLSYFCSLHGGRNCWRKESSDKWFCNKKFRLGKERTPRVWLLTYCLDLFRWVLVGGHWQRQNLAFIVHVNKRKLSRRGVEDCCWLSTISGILFRFRSFATFIQWTTYQKSVVGMLKIGIQPFVVHVISKIETRKTL